MMRRIILFVWAVIMLSLNALAQQKVNTDPEAAKIITSDIGLFWQAYDKAKPENNLNVFRDEYLRKGSPGLDDFRQLRIGNVCNLVSAIETAPKYYAALREPSLKVASYEGQMRQTFRKLKELYPGAVFPDVYFVVGRLSTGGTASRSGLLIGVEMYGGNEGAPLDELTNWQRAVVAPMNRVTYIVAHELIHYQQKNVFDNTLLAAALKEGVADFVAELIAGDTINPHLHKYGNPIEKELWLEFHKEMNGADVSNWLYQGDKAKDKPADLGYYMGYKIAESYYKNAKDKKQAVLDALAIKDHTKFLADSKYADKF